ncbi:MAG TPA: sigma-70 family RNA polymerase sigma factor, partial [Enhygromyxa sp.]|nr:sigma-70 family RNA polymerase sigma factor [Enhygromyxa sp.]
CQTMDLEELLRAVRDGNVEAWNALHQKLRRELRIYFLRHFDEATTDELMARTLDVLVDKLPGFDPEKESLGKWVFGIARNQRLIEYASRAQSKALGQLAALLQKPSTSPSAPLYAKEVHIILHEEIDELPPHYRAVMKNDLKGDDIREFAKRQNIPLRTAYSRRSRAIEILRERLSARLPEPLPLPTAMVGATSSSPSPPP